MTERSERHSHANEPTLRQILLGHLDYTAWADALLLDTCAQLPSDALERDLGASHGSVLRTLRHTYYAERVWLERLLADGMPPLVEVGDQRLFGDPSPEPDLDVLRQRWPSVWDGLRRYCEAASDAVLAGDLVGPDCRMARWQIVLHLANHSTLHRGQVQSMLRQLGVRPPNTDVFSHYLLTANR